MGVTIEATIKATIKATIEAIGKDDFDLRRVVVADYDANWPAMYEAEALRLKQIFGDLAEGIHHIGSTSVPGLQAKPVIDILMEVSNLVAVDESNEAMIEFGYQPMGEYGIPQRRYFQKGGEERTHHVHVFPSGHHEVLRHLAFRDYLRVHPEETKRYGDLKASLAEQFPFDIESYMDGKDALVKEIEQAALRWYEARK